MECRNTIRLYGDSRRSFTSIWRRRSVEYPRKLGIVERTDSYGERYKTDHNQRGHVILRTIAVFLDIYSMGGRKQVGSPRGSGGISTRECSKKNAYSTSAARSPPPDPDPPPGETVETVETVEVEDALGSAGLAPELLDPPGFPALPIVETVETVETEEVWRASMSQTSFTAVSSPSQRRRCQSVHVTVSNSSGKSAFPPSPGSLPDRCCRVEL